MNVRRHALTLLAALLVSSVAPKVFAQTKIAVVDLQRALMETEDGRRAKRRLERLFKRRQKSLDAAQNKMKQMKEDIERQQKAGVITDEALQRRLEEYQKAYMELQSQYVEYQRELAAKEAELTSGILEKMQQILRRMGQSEGYTLILEANEGGVVWVPGNLDLTDDLIQRYNSENGGGGGSSMMRSRMR
ncbi:MAG: OmpH family outer membrane protein [Deltaproteobacteria bacterium]|nr:OmpH family outer membrane protein [Deltaproteobacteria bacterium]